LGKFTRLVGGVLKSFDESSSLTIFDNQVTVGSTITTGTSVTIPGGQSYTGEQLEVYLNGQRLKLTDDYNSVSSTQVNFTFDLLAGDKVRYRIDRGA
jgi:hypothetical protein